MGSEKQPRRNVFDEIAAWLAGGEPGSPPGEVQPAQAEGDGRASQVRAARPRHSITRKRALIALAVTVAIGAVWGGWAIYQASRPPKAVTVLIADFQGRQAKRGVDWGDRIYQEVKDQVERLELGERVEVQRVYETFDDAEQARKFGDTRKATMVLWGWYDDINVRPRFELLQTAKEFESGLGPPPKDLTDFDLYLRSGPREMAYVVAVVLGLIQYSDGNYATAENLFTAALDNAPADAALPGQEIPRFYRAAARFVGNEPASRPMAAIVDDLQEATKLKPDFWQADWNLVIAYSDYCTPTLKLDSALAEAEKVRQAKPDSAESYWLLGLIRERRRELPEARAAYEQAVALDPGHVESFEALGKVLDVLGDSAAAGEAYREGLDLRQQEASDGRAAKRDAAAQDPVEALDQLGYAYLNAGQYDRAIETFNEVLRQRPDSAKYHRHLGNAYYWQGRTEEGKPSTGLDKAIAEYETARKLDPRDSLLLTVLGGAYQEAGRPDDALDAYRAAVVAAPCDDEALFLLAGQYDAVGRTADAEAAFRKLVELNPRQAVGWQWLATDAYQREDYAAAAGAYGTAASLEPDSADVFYGLGSSLYHLKDFAGAEEAYRQAKTLEPDDAASLAGWGDSLAKLGRAGEAIAAYERAVQMAPDYLTWLGLGLLYEQAGRFADAASAYGKAAELRPSDALAQAAAGAMRQRIGEHAAAAQAYERALQLDPENAAYWEALAVNYAALARPTDAAKAAEETLVRNPGSAAAHLVRAGIYEERGDRDKAREDYRQALALSGNNPGVAQVAQAALQRLGG